MGSCKGCAHCSKKQEEARSLAHLVAFQHKSSSVQE